MLYLKKIFCLVTISLFLMFGCVSSALAADGSSGSGGSGSDSSSKNSGTGASAGQHLGAAAGKSGAGYGDYKDPRAIAATTIKVILNFLGIIFVSLIVYAGFLWMTAGGSEDRVEKAKKLIYRSVIGLIIILAAYSITWLAFRLALGYTDNPLGPGLKTQVDNYYSNFDN